MTEKKKPAAKKPAAKKAPAKKAAAPRKPATKKADSDGDKTKPLTGAVTPPAEPSREKIEIKPAEPTPIPERAKAPAKKPKKGFFARLFRR